MKRTTSVESKPSGDSKTLSETRSLNHKEKDEVEVWVEPRTKVSLQFDGPILPGEARVPLTKLIVQTRERIERRNACASLVLYLLFLGIYVGILLCYPVTTIGEMGTEAREWLLDKEWGDQNTLDDVGTPKDFLEWFEDVIIDSVWGDVGSLPGVVMSYNSIVGGIVLWQRKKTWSTQCNPFEQSFVNTCVSVANGNKWDLSDVNPDVAKFLPKVSIFAGDDRNTFSSRVIPLYSNTDNNSNNQAVIATVDETKTVIRDIIESSWIDFGTNEIMIQLVMYNSNTKLLMSMVIRFVMRETGGIDNDVYVWVGVLNSLSNEIVEAKGTNYKFRITLEILFVLKIVTAILIETIEIYNTCKEYGMKKGSYKYLNFWNLFDWIFIIGAVILISTQVQIYSLQANVSDNLNVENLDKDTALESDFALIQSLSELAMIFDTMNAVLLFTAFFRLFKYFEFHPRLGIVSRTIAQAWSNIVHFALVLASFILGYAMTGFVLFSKTAKQFQTFASSMGAIGQMITLGIEYDEFVSGSLSNDFKWWAWLPSTLFYYGFMFIIFTLLLNILLAIILSAFDVVREEVDGYPQEQTTIFSDMKEFCLPACDLARKPKKFTRVDPVNPDFNESVRPALLTLLTELQEVKAMIEHGIEQPESPERILTPFRSLHGNINESDFIVVFNYADLAQTFSSGIARFLWINYGPNSQTQTSKDENEETERVSADTRYNLDQAEKIREMQISIDALHSKLDVFAHMLDALRTVQSPKNSVDSPTQTQLASEIGIALAQIHKHNEKQSASKTMSPMSYSSNEDETPYQNVETDEGRDQNENEIYQEKLTKDGIHEAYPDADAKYLKKPKEQAIGLTNTHNSSQRKKLLKETRGGKVSKLTSDIDQSEPLEDPEREKLKDFILAQVNRDGLCPLEKIKRASYSSQPPLDWEVVKKVRKELGIIQFKKLVREDGGSTVVRFWRLKSVDIDY